MMCPINRPLKLRPEAFNGVGVDGAASILLSGVVHGIMLEAKAPCVAIRGQFIRVERASRLGILPQMPEDVGITEARHGLAAHSTAALDNADHGSLASGSTAPLAGTLPADVGFIRLKNAHQLTGLVVGHQLANLVRHAPRRLVGHTKLALQFLCGHTVAGSGHEEHGKEPRAQRRAGLVEDRSRRGIKLMAAPSAGIGAPFFDWIKTVFLPAIGTSRPRFPAGFEDKIQARPVIGELCGEVL